MASATAAARALETAGKEAWDCIWPLSLVDVPPGKEACEFICSASSVEGNANRDAGACSGSGSLVDGNAATAASIAGNTLDDWGVG